MKTYRVKVKVLDVIVIAETEDDAISSAWSTVTEEPSKVVVATATEMKPRNGRAAR